MYTTMDHIHIATLTDNPRKREREGREGRKNVDIHR
jgi:hypothetical protein